MARRVAWAASAWRDLDEAAEFIAKGSRYYTGSFVAEIRDAARSLADFAQRGRVVPELDDPAVREVLVRSYRIIYHVSPAEVYVLGIIHGARDLPALWGRTGRSDTDS